MAQQEVQLLSKAKQRRSLGETKKREKSSKKPSRTAVVVPGDVEWPDVDAELSKEILNTIGRTMTCLNIPTRQCPLKEIKSVPKGQRAEFRQKWVAQHALEAGYDVSKYILKRTEIAIGVNCCSMNMECDHLVGLLIEKDVEPEIITKLLVPIAQSGRVPVISLTGLRTAFHKACGIKCIALGFKKACEMKSSDFYYLCELVVKNAPLDQHRVLLQAAAIRARLMGSISSFRIQQPSESIISSECVDPTVMVHNVGRVVVAVGTDTTTTSTSTSNPPIIPAVEPAELFSIQDEIDKLERKKALQKSRREGQAEDRVYIPPKIRKMTPQ